MGSEIYSFRVEEEDLKEVLSKLSGKERTIFIKNALRFYINFNQKIESIAGNVEKILDRIENGSAFFDSSKEVAAGKEEEILLSSIEDILNL